MNHMKKISILLLSAIAMSLGINKDHFHEDFSNPTELFRIFNYPPHDCSKFSTESMGVGEHTDYGFITILWQDCEESCLQVKSLNGESWIEAIPLFGTFIVNLGDALEHSTGGFLRATPHRVLQRQNKITDRLSFPYFFDPSFHAIMRSIVPLLIQYNHKEYLNFVDSDEKNKANRITARWDKQDPTLFQGTYGQYLMKKVSKAFPELAAKQLPPSHL